MRTIFWPILAGSLLSSTLGLGVEIVIKTPEGEKAEGKEEKKEEKEEKKEEEPELPKDAVLKINALNQTGYDFALHVLAVVKDEQFQGINLQNVSQKESVKMLGELVAYPDAAFQLNTEHTKVVALAPINFHMKCKVLESKPKEEKKAEDGDEEKKKDEGDEKKKDEGDGKKDKDGDEKKKDGDDKKKDQDSAKKPKTPEKNDEEDKFVAHKSIDFTFYLQKGDPFPKCVISFDSLPEE
ncbi:MAG TPA: hypothetical protein VEL47_01590 [Myxococcota bacterium]|nr:hypothetical protein [Myxococcota bacterium]